ncbi:hypothetical protein XENOCAPTIV_026167, partial [Xenoophorus captivus]
MRRQGNLCQGACSIIVRGREAGLGCVGSGLGGGEERQGPAHGRGIASLEPNRAIAASYLQPDTSSSPPATK